MVVDAAGHQLTVGTGVFSPVVRKRHHNVGSFGTLHDSWAEAAGKCQKKRSQKQVSNRTHGISYLEHGRVGMNLMFIISAYFTRSRLASVSA